MLLVAVKASAVPCYTTEPYAFRNLNRHIRRVVDACEPQRVFRGTTGLSPLPCPYRQALTPFPDELDSLSTEDKEWIMEGGIGAWLGWALPPD